MNRTSFFSRRRMLAGSLAAFVSLGIAGLAGRPAQAHEAKCPYCKLDVVQDTSTMDNEVALRYGRKRIEYRCVYCALAEAKTAFKGDLNILAPSEIKGKPVVISRKSGNWSAPAGVVFVGEKANHRHCQTTYRAFTSKAAFQAHVRKNKNLLKNARPLTLAQMVEMAK